MLQTIAFPQLTSADPAAITIIGLGPGALADLTLAAWQRLMSARIVVFRTQHHPSIGDVAHYLSSQGIRKEYCDDLYEKHDEFADVYDAITQRIVTLGLQEGSVVYAVPGSPWLGEATTSLIMEAATAVDLGVEIVGATSFVAPSFAAVGVDLMEGGQVVDAMLLAQQHHPLVTVTQPLLVAQIYARWLASDVKLTLLNAYPATQTVTLVQAAGTAQQRIQAVSLHELDHRDDFDHLTSLYVPPLPAGSSIVDLLELVAHLRAPEGCPWDQAQTLETFA